MTNQPLLPEFSCNARNSHQPVLPESQKKRGRAMSTADLPATEKRSAFAARLGVRRGYVTQLAKEGRIVCDAKGDVLVAESLQRIEDTRSPEKAKVAERWALARSGKAQADDGNSDHEGKDREGDAPPTAGSLGRATYTDARALREQYQALSAKADYEARMGQLCAADDVRRAGADIGATIRTQHESMADRLAPELASADSAERCYAILSEAFDAALRDISRSLERLAAKPEGVRVDDAR